MYFLKPLALQNYNVQFDFYDLLSSSRVLRPHEDGVPGSGQYHRQFQDLRDPALLRSGAGGRWCAAGDPCRAYHLHPPAVLQDLPGVGQGHAGEADGQIRKDLMKINRIVTHFASGVCYNSEQ